MLLRLAVKNLVLIEDLTVEFERGFNVLTGETGAGKSMIVDALNLVLGGRASPELVRQGAKEAEVEALFEVPLGSRLGARLKDAEIPGADTSEGALEVVIRRSVQEGRSRAFINGRLSTAAQLSELAPDLCDIASQHESVTLTDPATHLEYLDAYGHLADDRKALTALVEQLSTVLTGIEEARAAERVRAEREEFLEFQKKEIEELDPKDGEEVELQNERGRLRHAEKLVGAARSAADRLYEGEAAICDELGRMSSELEAAARIDGSLGKLARTVESARSELADAARELGRYAQGIDSNPARLDEVQERLFRLEKLLRRHGPTTKELLYYRDEIAGELERVRSAHHRLELLNHEYEQLKHKVADHALALSKKRRDVADTLADAVGRELAQLGMGRARVVVAVSTNSASPPALEVDGARLTRSGIDHVEFLIAPNRGEDPRPLRRIASGGELSRALLAIKRVLAEEGPAGLYVFDEVDAGVGGAIAEVIGRAIRDVARHRQVLCVTHLPQIAALGDAHYVVEKHESKSRTTTTIKKLSESERVEEIARMLGGVRVGDASRKAAAELLSAR